ncbi:MAG TPA: DUF4157 domain-containing protein, partial [Kofleriaceae bacterium]|nr:DUF4157 domain-containing protein [Kofleriaceae bacterium]
MAGKGQSRSSGSRTPASRAPASRTPGSRTAETSGGPGARSADRAGRAAEMEALQRAVGNRAMEQLVGAARGICDPDRARALRTAALLRPLAEDLGLRAGEVEVRVDDEAAARTRSHGAPGLAEGRVVHLDPAVYDARSPRSLELLAHELVHVAQARNPAPMARPTDGTIDAAEVEAAALAHHFAGGGRLERPVLGLAAGQAAAFSLADLSAMETLEAIKRQVADGVSDAVADRGPSKWVVDAMLRWAIGGEPDIDGEEEAEAARTAARTGREERRADRRAGREERRGERDQRRAVRQERRARRAADPDAFRAMRRLERAELRRLRGTERDIRHEMAADRTRRREERGAAAVNAGDVVVRLVRALLGVGGELLRATPIFPLDVPVDLDGLDLELVAEVGMRGIALSGSLETRLLGVPIRIGDPLSRAEGERPAAAAEPKPASATIVLGGVNSPEAAHRLADRLLRGARIAAGVVVRNASPDQAADLAITVAEADLDDARDLLAGEGNLGAVNVKEERGPERMPVLRERPVQRRARQVSFHFPWLSTDVYATLPETRAGLLATGPGYLTPSHLSLEWLELEVPDLGLSPLVDWGENGPPCLRIDQVDLGPGHGDLFDQLRFAGGPVSVTLLGGLVTIDGLDLAGGSVAAEGGEPGGPVQHSLRFTARAAALHHLGLEGELADLVLAYDPAEGLVGRAGPTRLGAPGGAFEISVGSVQVGPELAVVLRGGAVALGPLAVGFEQASLGQGGVVIDGVTPPLAEAAVRALLAGADPMSLLPGAGLVEEAARAGRGLVGALSGFLFGDRSEAEPAAAEPSAAEPSGKDGRPEVTDGATAAEPLDAKAFQRFNQYNWYDGSGKLLCSYKDPTAHWVAASWVDALEDVYEDATAEAHRVRHEAGLPAAGDPVYGFRSGADYDYSTWWNLLNDAARLPAGGRHETLEAWIKDGKGKHTLKVTVALPAAAKDLPPVMFLPAKFACFEAVKGMMGTVGATPLKETQANLFHQRDAAQGHVDRTDKALVEKIAAATTAAIAYLDATLPTPVMVGVSYNAKSINEGYADHWVVAHARGEDAEGVFYSFADPADGNEYQFRKDADGILVGTVSAKKFYEVQSFRKTESSRPVRGEAAGKEPEAAAPEAAAAKPPEAAVPDARDLAMSALLDGPEAGPRFHAAVVDLDQVLQWWDRDERAAFDQGQALLGGGVDYRAVARFREAAQLEGHPTELVFQELLDQVPAAAAIPDAPAPTEALEVIDENALLRDSHFQRTGGAIPRGTHVWTLRSGGAYVQVMTPPSEPFHIGEDEGVWTAASNLGRAAPEPSAPTARTPAPTATTPAPTGGSTAPAFDLAGRDQRFQDAVPRLRAGPVPDSKTPADWITDELLYDDHPALLGAGGIAGVKDAAERTRLSVEWTDLQIRYGIPVARYVAYTRSTVPSGDLVDVASTAYRDSITSTESGSYDAVNRRGRATPDVPLPARRKGDYEWALGRYQFMEATLFGLKDDIARIRPGYDLVADQKDDWKTFLADTELQDELFTPYNNKQAGELFAFLKVASWAELLAAYPEATVARAGAGSPSRNLFMDTPWFARGQEAHRTWENVAVVHPWVTVTRKEIRVQTTVSGALGAMHLGGAKRVRNLLTKGITSSDNLGTST